MKPFVELSHCNIATAKKKRKKYYIVTSVRESIHNASKILTIKHVSKN